MSPDVTLRAFPWHELPRVPRATAKAAGRLQRHLARIIPNVAASLEQAMERWLHRTVHFDWRAVAVTDQEPNHPEPRLRLLLDRGQYELVVCLDNRLIYRLVALALGHGDTLYDPLEAPSVELLGATAAILAKLIEDAGIRTPLQFLRDPVQFTDAQRLAIAGSVQLDAACYPFSVGIANPRLPPRESQAGDLSQLGSVPLSLPIVIGVSTATRDVLAELAPNRAFVTGTGLWVDARRVGRGLLIAPRSERGIAVTLEPSCQIVLGHAGMTLNHDHANPAQTAAETSSIVDAVSEAPVVVRVELGALTLPAKQWVSLQPGDIVETGQPLGSEVTLRVAGQALARGELLNVDGELGVRITQLMAPES